MNATFVELPPFERLRAEYMDDAAYRELQVALMANPEVESRQKTGRKKS